MTATIDEHGMLTIKAETPLESYALNRWCDEQFSKENKPALYTNKITIQTGL